MISSKVNSNLSTFSKTEFSQIRPSYKNISDEMKIAVIAAGGSITESVRKKYPGAFRLFDKKTDGDFKAIRVELRSQLQ